MTLTHIRGAAASSRARQPRLLTLAIGASLALGVAGTAFGQATTGNIFGQAQPGQTVIVSGSTGVTRQAVVDETGRFRFGNLPLGDYKVSLQRDGATIMERHDVTLVVGAGTEVNFNLDIQATSLDAVSVSASALPSIDVASVDSRTVLTAKDLERLPLARHAEAIALLAPGAVSGSGAFTGPTGQSLVSFGGASVSENAYYINGFNTTDPLAAMGGIGLPYGAVDQQEVYTGGYSAMYGRSDGGVISQVGKRGTNQWKFGGQVLWSPRSLASDPRNVYFPDQALPDGYDYTNASQPGTIYRSRKNNTSWTTVYSAYAGGPLIKDRLYLFVAAEAEKQQGTSTTPITSSQPANNQHATSRPKHYAKLDWNINANNILELTSIGSKQAYAGSLYDYDYATGRQGDRFGFDTSTKTSSDITIGKITSYVTDDLTLSATYGIHKVTSTSNVPGDDPTRPFLSAVTNQDPSITGGAPIRNGVTSSTIGSPHSTSQARGLRLDAEYRLGNHQLAAGIDNMRYNSRNIGKTLSGPGYAWIYGKTARPDVALVPSLGVGAPGGDGYFVHRYISNSLTSSSVDQKAQYIEDRWQVSDRWLLSLGLRNDQFTNFNNVGQAYVRNTNQWAPRLGFAWDVLGDASFKLYGNLGRYYLALPTSVAIRGASASTMTSEYFTYTGIDPVTGAPTGLAPIGPGPVSSNGEYGQAPDPRTVAARDLKSQYQDEAILGFSKQLGSDWVYGAKATVRKLQTAIDDVCDYKKLEAKAKSQGIDVDAVNISHGCLIFNPGQTNTFLLSRKDGSGYEQVRMSAKDWGFDGGAKRKYYALDLFVEHPFDGKWHGRVDYTFSRSYGNTEGQVLSTLGQDDVSKTQDWDFASLMANSNGVLSNDRTHQLKIYGAYQVTSEWMVSGSLRVNSGAPRACLGYFGNDESDPAGYRSSYRFCGGKSSALGSNGRLPWTRQLDAGVTYRPAFAGNKLGFNATVFNVTNERKPLSQDVRYQTSPYTVSNTYGLPTFLQPPRYVRLSASYDF